MYGKLIEAVLDCKRQALIIVPASFLDRPKDASVFSIQIINQLLDMRFGGGWYPLCSNGSNWFVAKAQTSSDLADSLNFLKTEITQRRLAYAG